MNMDISCSLNVSECKYQVPFDSALYLPVNAHITAICAFQTVILRNMEKSKDLILMVSLKLFFYYWAF